MKITNLNVADCYVSPTNPRKNVGKESFKDLVASIKEKGVIVPVIARKKGTIYEIVAGNRRLLAATEAGLKEIPADVRDITDAEAREIQIIENLHREGVHPLEEGAAYRELMEKGKQEIASIAVKTGKSEAYVRGRLALTDLTAKAAAAFRDGKISAGHAALICRLEPADQEKALKREEAKQKREAKTIETAARKVKLPIGSNAINALLEIMIREVREDGIRTIVKGKGWEVLRVKVSYAKNPVLSYEATLRAQAKKMTDEQKIQLVFEGFIAGHWDRKKIIKML